MLRLCFVLLVTLYYCECVFVSSSFWAPLFNPRILNYRVDVPFNPDAGKIAREDYSKRYGDKGKSLIANLGNGNGPNEAKELKYADVKFMYTYPGATNKNRYEYR